MANILSKYYNIPILSVQDLVREAWAVAGVSTYSLKLFRKKESLVKIFKKE